MSIFGSITRVPAEVARKIIIEADCPSGVSLGDIVRYSSTVANEVETLSSNVYASLAVGVVVEKPTSTTCKVQMVGVLEDNLSGLTTGKPIFVGTSGEATTTPPVTGSLQVLGVAIDVNKALLNVQFEKVVRN